METSEGLTMEYLTPSLLLCSLATTSAAIVATALWKAMKPIKRKMKNKEDYFDDINANLQNDLRNKLLGKINEVKQEIKFKTLQKEKNVKHLLKQQQDEIAIKQSQFMIEKFEIESRYKEKLELLEKEVVDDINHLKDSLKDLSIILANAGPGESGDMVTSARSELECPVCLEEMRPPKRIWQCSDGHAICDSCRKRPNVTCCPVCRKYIVGRSNIAEKMARVVFGSGGVGEREDKITLTGYREVMNVS